ncbi:MAG TPA: C40 family peptidase [Pyrinomonadaceae bacterium]|nr:C40 family peptidase [Pyrinomonadaceae bacterium]
MDLKKLFPYALAACFALGMFPVSAAAQSGELRQRQATPTLETINLPVPEPDEPVIISLASPEDINRAKSLTEKNGSSFQFKDLMNAAIEQRLGSPYSWGATGPSAFDCSGFVWSTFRSVGIDFERASARTLWARFTAPAAEENFKYGTLVFFSNLAHVGIVVDGKGFYHASRRKGVIYSPFNEYWTSRIDGFRQVPQRAPLVADAAGK